jgi:hypothetical protein
LVLVKKAWVVETDGAAEEAPGICLGFDAVLERAGGWDDIAVAEWGAERRRLSEEDGVGDRLQASTGAGVEEAEQGRVGSVGGGAVVLRRLVVVMMVIDLHKGVWWEEEEERLRAGREVWMRHGVGVWSAQAGREKQSLLTTRAASSLCHSVI